MANANLGIQLKTTEQILRANGDATKSLSERFGGLAQKFGAWLSITQVIMLAVRAVRQMVKASVELDSAMTQMQIITKASASEMEAFGDAAAKVAKRTASTITDVVDSATTYARLGYTMGESTQLAEFTAMLQNVGDIDVSDAQNAITAIVKAFDIDASQIESVMDKLVETGNHFPISVAQIAEGMNNASSSLAAAGNSFEQSVALLTAANTTIQDAAKSSTGLRTIAARIRNTKTELDDLGEVMTQASYEELVQTLTDCGVALTDINGEYRSTYDIMSDIAAKWSDMDSMRQAALATALSGTRQQAVFYSIVEQFQEAQGAMDAMANSAGVLSTAYDTYLNSAQAHINQFKAAFQELSSNIATSGLVKTIVDIGTAILTVINALQRLHILLPTIVASILIIKGINLGRQMAESAAKVSVLSASLLANKGATDSLAASVAALSVQEKQRLATQLIAAGQEGAHIATTLGLVAADGALTVANTTLATSFKSLMASIPVWGWIALGISVVIEAVSLLTNSIGSSTDKVKELEDEFDQLKSTITTTANNFRDLKASAEEVIPRFVELSRGVNEFGENVSLTDDEYAEFLQLNNKIAEMFPELNLGMDDSGNAMLALSYSADTLSESLYRLVDAQRQAAYATIAETMPDVLEDISSIEKQYKQSISAIEDVKSEWQKTYDDIVNRSLPTNVGRYSTIEAGGAAAREMIKQAQALGMHGNVVYDNQQTTNNGYVFSIQWDYDSININDAKNLLDAKLAEQDKLIHDYENKIQAKWKSLNPVVNSWLQTDFIFNDLNDQMQLVAEAMVSGLDFSSLGLKTKDEVTDYITQNILDPLFLADDDVKNAFAQITDWKDALNNGEITADEFATRVRELFQNLLLSIDPSKVDTFKKAFVSGFNAIGFAGSDFNSVVDSIIDNWGNFTTAGQTGFRDVTSVAEKALGDLVHYRNDLVQQYKDGLSQLSDEDFAIASRLVERGEYHSWNELVAAIEEYRNSVERTADDARESLKSLWDSEGFDKTRENIIKLAGSVDGISAKKVEELASSSEELAAILEVDGINAQFLARILQTEALGGDGFALITEDALILNQALEGMTRRFGEVTEAKSRYDAAMSVPEKDTDFRSMAGAFKELNDQFVAGTTNSNAFWAAAEFLFGTEQLDAWGWEDGLENIYAAMQKNVGVFEDADSAGAGFLERLNEIAEGGQVLGEDGSVIATIEKFADGSFEFDVDALHLSELAEQMGMSEEAVMSCLEALSMWGDIDYYDIQEVLGAIKEIGLSSDNFDGVAVNVSALTDQLISLGYTNKDIHDILTDLQAVDGVTLVDVNASVSSLVDNLTNLGIAASENGTIVIDVQGLANLASDLGMTQGEAETLITKLYEADGITMTNANGEVTSLDDALAALDGKTFTSVTSELDGIASSAQSAETAVQSLQTRINGLTGKTVTITVNEVRRSSILSGITGYASGTSNAPAGDAVVGEDGEELVVHKDSAYVAGSHGAEIAHLESGDKVYTADETKRILSSAKQIRGIIPAYSGGSPGRAGGRIGFGGWGSVIGGSGSGSGSGSGGGSGSGSGSGSGHSTGKDTSKEEESWFEKQYKLHNHLIKMCQEDMEDYLAWLNTAYQQAYDEGIIDLDDYRKYQEEVYEGLQDLFKDYLSDVEHEIDMRSMFEGESPKIISLYKQLIKDVEKEIAAARAAGLDDTDDYIQELHKKWADYTKSVKEMEEDARDGAKDAVDELIEYRIKMLKQEADKEKDSLKKKLDNLKEFYDKQKEMLQDVYDEEKYLDEQSEKRKSVTDIQAELAQLEFDDSAWAQKRKLQLQQELADAQKELEDFEKQHALDEALGLLDDAYDAQEKEINAEMEALEEKLNDPEALYNQALADIRNNTEELYQEMLEYNRRYGTGNDEDVADMWEAAYKALLEYHDINGEWYNGIDLGNYTGYTPPQESWDTAPVSEPGSQTQPEQPSTPTQPSTTETPTLTDSIKKHVAAAIWNGNYGWGNGSTRANRLTEVFGSNNGIQAIVNKGYQYVAGTSPSGYSYTDMRKKFKGYASGTRKAAPGMHAVDELGAEYLFTSADGNRYRVFSGGEKVLNAKATEFLYEFANSGKDILEKIAKSFMDASSLDRIQPIINHNDIHLGDITIQGNADRATVSEIRRAQRESLETMLREFNRLNR